MGSLPHGIFSDGVRNPITLKWIVLNFPSGTKHMKMSFQVSFYLVVKIHRIRLEMLTHSNLKRYVPRM